MNKQALLREIHALDFAILEFGLYLDTHPWDTRALAKRQELQGLRREKVAAYEKRFGPYIVKSTKVQGTKWSWIDNPWPCEYDGDEKR